MSTINLTEATRTNLQTLQNAARVNERSARQLATALKVEKATDDAVSYFQARSITNRVSDLFEIKDNIGQALSAVESTLDGVEALDQLAKQLRGIALSARGGTAEARAAAAEQFDSIREQIGHLAEDISYQGTSLLSASPDNLSVDISESSNAKVTIEGSASDASGLGIPSALGEFLSFEIDAYIDSAVEQVDAAISQLRSNASSFGSDIALLSTRENFISNFNNTLEEGAAKLVNADLNEAAAVALSGQFKQQLGTAALRLTAQSEQSVGQLLFS